MFFQIVAFVFVVSASDTNLVAADNDIVCPECLTLPNTVDDASAQVRYFRFADLTQSLTSLCPVDSDLIHRCSQRKCGGHDTYNRLWFVTEVFERACSHLNQFQAESACWTDQFTSLMTACVPDRNLERMRNCVSDNVRSLPTCSAAGQTFFLEFFDFVLDTM